MPGALSAKGNASFKANLFKNHSSPLQNCPVSSRGVLQWGACTQGPHTLRAKSAMGVDQFPHCPGLVCGKEEELCTSGETEASLSAQVSPQLCPDSQIR
jgi:hypothetical protein